MRLYCQIYFLYLWYKMPYSRRFTRRRSRRSSRRTRSRRGARSAASTIQSAWRRRARTKRGSLVARTAKAAYRGVKKIRKNMDTKFVKDWSALRANNFIGQQADVVSITSLGGTDLQGQAQTFKMFIGTPVVIPHESNAITLGDVAVNTREDAWVTMKSLTIKGTAIGGNAADNAGAVYANIVQNQKVYMYVILDRNPKGTNPNPMNPASVFNNDYVPAHLFQPNATDPTSNPTDYPLASQNLLGYVPGYADDAAHLSWANPATMYGPNCRFKIIAKKTWYVSQYEDTNTAGLGTQGKYVRKRDFSFTLKIPYKFHFASSRALTPDNQTLLIALCSNVAHSVGGPNPYIDPPAMRYSAKLRFKDH